MAHHIVCMPATDEDLWAASLSAILTEQEHEGWTLAAMTERSVRVEQPGGMASATRDEQQLVLVFHRP